MAVSKRLRFEVLKRDNYTCRYCRASDGELTIDHVTPVALGGTDRPNNLVAACVACNSGKTSMAPDAPPLAELTDREIAYEKARARVVARRLEDDKRRRAVQKRVEKYWDVTNGTYPAMPDDWRNSVDMWSSRGLDGDRIVDAIRIANSKYLPAQAVWTYAAKICWNWITDIEEAVELELKSTESEPEIAFDGARIVELFIDKRTHLIPKMPENVAV